MAIIGYILSSERVNGPNKEKYPALKIDQGGGATSIAALMNPPGVDALPLPGDVALVNETLRSGGPKASGTIDPSAEPVAQPGEYRVTARVAEDDVKRSVSEVYLKSDGTLLINTLDENGDVVGGVQINPDGSSAITTPHGTNMFNTDGSVAFSSGAQIDASGDFITAAGISLNTHRHIGNLGTPTGPAIP